MWLKGPTPPIAPKERSLYTWVFQRQIGTLLLMRDNSWNVWNFVQEDGCANKSLVSRHRKYQSLIRVWWYIQNHWLLTLSLPLPSPLPVSFPFVIITLDVCYRKVMKHKEDPMPTKKISPSTAVYKHISVSKLLCSLHLAWLHSSDLIQSEDMKKV